MKELFKNKKKLQEIKKQVKDLSEDELKIIKENLKLNIVEISSKIMDSRNPKNS